MKERGMTSDILTALISVFSSFVLILLIVLFAAYTSLMYVLDDGGVNSVVRNVGYTNIAESNKAVKSSLKAYGIDDENLDEFMKSKGVKEAISLYGKDLKSAISGDMDSKPVFTTENVQAAMVKNLDELVEIIAEEGLSEEEALLVESRIVAAIKKTTDKVVKNAQSRDDIALLVSKSGFSGLLEFLTSPSLKGLFIVVILILCIAIIALRYYKFGGLIWIGVDFSISAVFTLILGFISIFGVFSYLFVDDGYSTAVAVEKTLALRIFFSALIIILIAVLFFIVYDFCKKRFLKGEKTEETI